MHANMKYFANLFLFLTWYLEKISGTNATNITQEELIRKLRLTQKTNQFIRLPYVMITFKRNVLILNEAKIFIIYSDISENPVNWTKISSIDENHFYYPTSIAKAPDGAFDVPSVTVTSLGKITQLDVSDPMNPTIASDLVNGSSNMRYTSHVWINKNEFLAVDYDVLLHFGNKNKSEAEEWSSKRVSSGKFYDMFLFKYAPNSFDVVYARSIPRNAVLPQIVIMWAEDEEGRPGNWRNEEHIRKEYIKGDSFCLTHADLNNDRKVDLLAERDILKRVGDNVKWYVEVRAYEIPHSEEFQNPDNYTEHLLFSFQKDAKACHSQLKAFIPFVSYKGKPWILIGDKVCYGAWYLVPKSDEVGDWSYRLNEIAAFGNNVRIVDVADINQDGYTELLLLSNFLQVMSFSNGKIDPPSISPRPTPSSSSIFYLDSTLLMFIWLFL